MSSRAFPRKPAEHDRLITLRDAWELYGVSKWIIYSQAALGKIRSVTLPRGGRVYYLESEIRALKQRAFVWMGLAS